MFFLSLHLLQPTRSFRAIIFFDPIFDGQSHILFFFRYFSALCLFFECLFPLQSLRLRQYVLALLRIDSFRIQLPIVPNLVGNLECFSATRNNAYPIFQI